MTVGLRDFPPELARLPLLFRETFRSRDAVERGGAALVGSGTTFSDGLVLNGSGNLLYSRVPLIPAAKTIKVELTAGFVIGDGNWYYVFDFDEGAGANRTLLLFGADRNLYFYTGSSITTNTVTWVNWNTYWNIGGKNTLVISSQSGASYIWLNGTLIDGSGVAFTNQNLARFAIGSRYAGLSSPFVGTIHSLEIYGSVATAADEPHIRDGSIVSDIDLDKCLAYLPGKSFYKRASDSKFVTEVRGRAGITEALMGSDGLTTAQFPSIIRPRGFSFDGGDQINLGDSDSFSFGTGLADSPFSLALLCRVDSFATARAFLTKAASLTVGEWALYVTTTGLLQFLTIDESVPAYRGRAAGVITMTPGIEHVIVATCDGTGLVGGYRIYLDNARVDSADLSNGVYVAMENGATPVRLGHGLATGPVASPLVGTAWPPVIDNVEWSPLHVKAITARLRRLARTA